MGGGPHGYPAALAMRQNMPERISSSPGTDGLPLFISSSTDCPEMAARCIDPSGGNRSRARAAKAEWMVQNHSLRVTVPLRRASSVRLKGGGDRKLEIREVNRRSEERQRPIDRIECAEL